MSPFDARPENRPGSELRSPSPEHVRTTTTDGLRPAAATRRWVSCAYCWGQRRIWEQVQAANGEGTILVATLCPGCLGIGETLR